MVREHLDAGSECPPPPRRDLRAGYADEGATGDRASLALRDLFFCDRADPAALFEVLPNRPSRKTFDAALAAFLLVAMT